MANEYLATAYDEFNDKKAARLRDCAKILQFRVYESGEKRLHSMSSCRVRLCPLCSWRRSLKVHYNTTKIIDFLSLKRGYKYIMLTLTVKNCVAEDLSKTIDQMMSAWNRMWRYPEIDKAILGWYRGLEITHNTDINSPHYNTYHPHFHCLLAVNPSYFTSRDYISQEKWTSIWQKAMRLDYIPIVDVRKVNGTTSQAVAEVAKYSVKDNDYIIPDDWDLTVNTVKLLDKALDNRRLVAYGRAMREAKRLLNLEDEENANLVEIGNEKPIEEKYIIDTYFWYSGYRQYGLIDSRTDK